MMPTMKICYASLWRVRVTSLGYVDTFATRHVACSCLCSYLSRVCVVLRLLTNLTQKEKLAVKAPEAHVFSEITAKMRLLLDHCANTFWDWAIISR